MGDGNDFFLDRGLYVTIYVCQKMVAQKGCVYSVNLTSNTHIGEDS